MIKGKLLGVEQRPKEVFQTLFVLPFAPGPMDRFQFGVAGSPVDRDPIELANDFIARKLLLGPLLEPTIPCPNFLTDFLAVLQMKQLRQRHLTHPFAGTSRHPIAPTKERQEIGGDPGLGQLNGPQSDGHSFKVIGHAGGLRNGIRQNFGRQTTGIVMGIKSPVLFIGRSRLGR